MALPIAQSPSVQDLLSARSKRSHQNLATNSIYSTITTLSAKTELDLSESARLAMAQESAHPVWSPSMSSTYDDDQQDCDPAARDGEIDDDGSSTQNEHVHASTHNNMYNQSPNPDLATPTMSESEYSRSPSLGSVRMAAVVQKAVPTSGLGISSDSSAPSSSSSSIDNDQYTPTASPSKRVMNARNLIINTIGASAARPYPHQTTTPPIAMPNSAKIENSPPPLTSRSVPETSTITNNTSSPLRTATLPPVPHTAVPIRNHSQGAALQAAKFVHRSSTDSSLSYLSSPILDDDDSLGPHKASLLRMQSFLGPKMKHISPAPWSTDAGDAASVVSTSSRPVSEAASGIWSEIDSEIGSVHLATKSVARTVTKGNSKDGTTPSTATGTLKGLGFAIASASAVVANAATGGSASRPSMSSERSAKSRTTTASSAFSTWSGTSRGTTNDGGKIGLSRSQSQEPFDASSIPPPPLPSPSAATAAMKVTNITRSKSPENYPPLPPSAITPNFPPLSRSVSPADRLDSEPGSDTPFSQLKPVTSAPEGDTTFTAASACIHALSSSLPETGMQGSSSSKNSRKTPTLPRKRPPMLHQDSTFSNTTSTCTGEPYNSAMSHSTSQTSLPAGNSDPSDLASKANSPNGMKLISLQDARERERERGNQAAKRRAEQLQQMQQMHQHQQQANAQRARQAQLQALTNHQAPPPHPTSAPPPPPPTKTLKSKKSGFLKLFKHKEDHSQAPAVPRPSTDTLPSPKISHGFAPNARNVSGPTDLRKIDNVLHIGPPSPTMAISESRRPAPQSDFASAVPFPHQRPPNALPNAQAGDEIRKSGSSAPPQVSLIKPSPDLSKTQAFFGDDRGGLSVQDHRIAANPSQTKQGDALAPSLSLRPVSMMLSSMPQNFLAEMEKSVKKSAHLKAVQTPGGSSGSSLDSLGGHTSPARTPDTPSFVLFDSDNNATPPSGQTPNTPATEQFDDSPSPTNTCRIQSSKPAFGLPTPPHSASSARTFSASNLPPVPTSPSSSPDQAREHAVTAAYKAKIIELEQLVIGLRAEMNAAQGEPIQIILSDSDCKDPANAKKACTSCGCCCKTSANSVLSRPRVVGHGNMFSSGRG